MQQQQTFYRLKPDGDIDPAGEAGWYLQRERERRGETLALAGRACGVHPHHLEAIESGDLTRLPARNEALRMIGAYGGHLGFDPQPLVLHYAQFLPKPIKISQAARRAVPKPLGSAKIISFPTVRALTSGAAGVVLSCLASVLLFGAASWMLAPSAEHAGPDDSLVIAAEDVDSFAESGADVPVASITRPAEAPLDERGGDAAAAHADEAADGLPGLAELISREISPTSGAAGPPETAPAAEPAPAQPAAPGRAYGTGNADARLVLRAKAPVWVRIEDQKGNLVMTQTLLTGDSYRVPNRSDLVIIARDGGLLTFEIDGVSKGDLGAPGEILVGRSLDLQSLGNQG